MEWTSYSDPAGAFTLDAPSGWLVQSSGNSLIVASPSGQMFVAMDRLPGVAKRNAGEILKQGLFPSAARFPGGRAGPIETRADGGAACNLNFMLPGAQARARLVCVPVPEGLLIWSCGAPVSGFAGMESILNRIMTSFAKPLPAASKPASGFSTFVDPSSGSFTVEVPAGWQVRGGLTHPGIGDLRSFIELHSPDGIQIRYGDPDCPQTFCHYPMHPEGREISHPSGAVLINLPASARRLAEWYMQTIGSRRFPEWRKEADRDRSDLVDRGTARAREAGVEVPSGLQMESFEIRFTTAGGLAGSCVATSMLHAGMSVGFWQCWDGNITVWTAPPALAAEAERTSRRVIDSFRPTPRMAEIIRRDESHVAAGGEPANAARQGCSPLAQNAAPAESQFGGVLLANYWDQPGAGPQSLDALSRRHADYDRIFERSSDALLDRQRLFDDQAGKAYEASSGYSYYWLDPHSGQVIGTLSADPPDRIHKYTPLRKL